MRKTKQFGYIYHWKKCLQFKAVSKLSFTLIINSIYWNSPCDHFQAFILSNWTEHLTNGRVCKRKAGPIANHLLRKVHSARGCLWCSISWQHINRCSFYSLCRSGRWAYKTLGRRAVIMKVWENQVLKCFLWAKVKWVEWNAYVRGHVSHKKNH